MINGRKIGLFILTNGDAQKCNLLLSSVQNCDFFDCTYIINDGETEIGRNQIGLDRKLKIVGKGNWRSSISGQAKARWPAGMKLELGTRYWNTPKARNIAQLIALFSGMDHYLFFDDDHLVEDKALFAKLLKKAMYFEAPTVFQSVGTPDRSAIEHITRKIAGHIDAHEAETHDGLGGCFFVSNWRQLKYFPNFYNEDVAWLKSQEAVEFVDAPIVHMSSPCQVSSLSSQEMGKLKYLIYASNRRCREELRGLGLYFARYTLARVNYWIKRVEKHRDAMSTEYRHALVSCREEINGICIDSLVCEVLKEREASYEWDSFVKHKNAQYSDNLTTY